MTNLKIIEQALGANKEITIRSNVVLGKCFKNLACYSYSSGGLLDYYNEVVIYNIIYAVAPRVGLYKIEKLNEFMKNLIPNRGLTNLNFRNFKKYNNKNDIKLGFFDLKEPIEGKLNVYCEIDLLSEDAFLKSVKDRKISFKFYKEPKRGISVIPLPDEEYLEKYAKIFDGSGCLDNYILNLDKKEIFYVDCVG